MSGVQDPLRITRELSLPLREIELRASRSSGPGGQHANVTASRLPLKRMRPSSTPRASRVTLGMLACVIVAG